MEEQVIERSSKKPVRDPEPEEAPIVERSSRKPIMVEEAPLIEKPAESPVEEVKFEHDEAPLIENPVEKPIEDLKYEFEEEPIFEKSSRKPAAEPEHEEALIIEQSSRKSLEGVEPEETKEIDKSPEKLLEVLEPEETKDPVQDSASVEKVEEAGDGNVEEELLLGNEAKPEEDKSPEAAKLAKKILAIAFEKRALASITKVVESKQLEAVTEYREVKSTGKVCWSKTHFIFVIDCSGSMRGSRWESVKSGFNVCLNRIKAMKDVLISAYTFDDKPNPFCRERGPVEAINFSKKIPFTGKGTNYARALEYAINLIKKCKQPDYLTCILFLSDGLGGYPEDCIKELQDLRSSGKKVLFYTVACETDEDKDMVEMATHLEGEHFKVETDDAAKLVFSTIIGV